MYILKSKSQIERASEKARKVRTHVKFIAFGIYSVRGSKGNYYTVKCEKIGNEKQVSCGCLGASKGLVCWHSAAALSLHVGLAKMRQTV